MPENKKVGKPAGVILSVVKNVKLTLLSCLRCPNRAFFLGMLRRIAVTQ
jgi:hypothetical protein